jgi:hypothetical protein
MKSIIFIGFILLIFTKSLTAQETELLTNPDFTDGTNGWWAYGADISINNGEVTFDISNAGINPWDIQLGQGNLTLKQGYKYTLCWRAKRESGTLGFNVGLGAAPYTLYFSDNSKDYDGNWQESCYVYTHQDEDVSNVALTVNMGGNDANAVFDFIRITEELSESDDTPANFVNQSYTHPGVMETKDVPQFVCLSFDDNIDADGTEWLCQQVEDLKNPHGNAVGLSFFFLSNHFEYSKASIDVVNEYLAGDESHHEICNHTYDHPHLEYGRTIEEWKYTIKQGLDSIANYTNVTLSDLVNAGFRAPYVETSEEMYGALNEMGVRYDHSSATYYNTNNEAGWPYMYQSETAEDLREYLWKVPISDLFVPESIQELNAYGIDSDIESQIGGNKVDAGDYHLFERLKLNSSSILGLLKYNLDRSLSGNRAPFTFCFHSQYYSEERAAAIDANSNTTLQQRQNLLISFIDYCQQKEEVYLSTVGQMLDWMENPISPEILYTNPGLGPVSYYGEMQVNGNRIFGERTQAPVQAKGMSFFWSLWGGEEFWTEGAVNSLVDYLNVELIRVPMTVDEEFNNLGGYLHEKWKETQIAYVETLVDAAIARDIYVIIDYHSHYADEHPDNAKEFFGYMAQKYGQYDNVIFEIYNEPIDTDWPTIKSYAETVIETIREYSDNLVLVGTEFFSSKVYNASLSPVADDNTAYVFHFYANYDGSASAQDDVIAAIENNVAVFASEWGNIYPWGEKDGLTDDFSFQQSDEWHVILDNYSISSANWCVLSTNMSHDSPNEAAILNNEFGSISRTGEHWNDVSRLTPSGLYMYNMLNEQAEKVQWRKAQFTNTVDVTFTVNMQDEIISDDGVFIQVKNYNNESEVEMTANGSAYSVTLSLPVGSYIKYRFKNGNEAEVSNTQECISWDDYRLIIVPDTDYAIETVCFNSCSSCVENESYTISTTSSPPEGGAVTGGGSYEGGTVITLEATQNAGYKFVNWTENDTVVSTNPDYSFTVSQSRTLVANFENTVGVFDQIDDLNIHIYPNPTNGKVTIEGKNIEIIKVFNIYGEIVKKIKVSSDKTNIHLEKLSKATYILRLTTDDKISTTKILLN